MCFINLTCIIDENIQSLFTCEDVLGQLSYRLQRCQVQLFDNHIVISAHLPHILRSFICSVHVSTGQNYPCTCTTAVRTVKSVFNQTRWLKGRNIKPRSDTNPFWPGRLPFLCQFQCCHQWLRWPSHPAGLYCGILHLPSISSHQEVPLLFKMKRATQLNPFISAHHNPCPSSQLFILHQNTLTRTLLNAAFI